jgi:acyl carrier protein
MITETRTMNREDRVRHILSLILDINIPEGHDFHRDAEPGWDSLKHVEIIFALEDEFDVQFDEDSLSTLVSLSEIVTAIGSQHAA